MNFEERVLSHLRKQTKKSIANNSREIASALKITENKVIPVLKTLQKSRAIRVAGHDEHGPAYAYVERKPRCNPSPGKRAKKKARDWYQNDRLVTKARKIQIMDDLEFVEIGEILAIEYESKKFEGRKVAYRHEVTHHRKMHLSTDGSVIIIEPAFKVTKRGIEG